MKRTTFFIYRNHISILTELSQASKTVIIFCHYNDFFNHRNDSKKVAATDFDWAEMLCIRIFRA